MGNFLRKLGSGKSRSSRSMSLGTTSSESHQPSISVADKINAAKKKYALIPDRFTTLDQVRSFFFFFLCISISSVDLTFGAPWFLLLPCSLGSSKSNNITMFLLHFVDFGIQK